MSKVSENMFIFDKMGGESNLFDKIGAGSSLSDGLDQMQIGGMPMMLKRNSSEIQREAQENERLLMELLKQENQDEQQKKQALERQNMEIAL